MELKTIVLDGQEYVLIPRGVFEKSIGVEPETIPEVIPTPQEESPAIVEDNTLIVDSVGGVKKAQGGTYEYRERLKSHKLLPEDVMILKNDFEVMPESPEIARNDFKNKIPPGKWGFYGPGAERDLG